MMPSSGLDWRYLLVGGWSSLTCASDDIEFEKWRVGSFEKFTWTGGIFLMQAQGAENNRLPVPSKILIPVVSTADWLHSLFLVAFLWWHFSGAIPLRETMHPPRWWVLYRAASYGTNLWGFLREYQKAECKSKKPDDLQTTEGKVDIASQPFKSYGTRLITVTKRRYNSC